jgi:heterodisulfide reductase subunit A-like polyferredoxin
LREQEVLDITIMYTGGDTQSLIRNEHFAHGPQETKLVPARVKLVHSREDGLLSVRYLPLGNATAITEEFDMVVLGADIEPSKSISGLADLLGVTVTEEGYIQVSGEGHAVATSRPGIFAAGCATAPKDVSRTLKEAKAAVREALRRLGVAIPASVYEHEECDSESKQPQNGPATIQHYEALVQRLMALGGGGA